MILKFPLNWFNFILVMLGGFWSFVIKFKCGFDCWYNLENTSLDRNASLDKFLVDEILSEKY